MSPGHAFLGWVLCTQRRGEGLTGTGVRVRWPLWPRSSTPALPGLFLSPALLPPLLLRLQTQAQGGPQLSGFSI